MNIFYLDESPTRAAQYHCDKHVVKMILEQTQILSTVHRILDGFENIDYSTGRKKTHWKLNDERESILYKATHKNHPCTLWARHSSANYIWLLNMTEALLDEYTHRYGKIHKSSNLISALRQLPNFIPRDNFTKPALAMPDYCKLNDPVTAYRNYYIQEKASFCTWSKREKPEWFKV